MQMLNNNHSLKKFWWKTLTRSWRKPIHTLVVNLPMSNSTTLPKNNPPKRLRHTPRDNKPRTRAKESPLKWEQVMLCLNEGKTSSIYMIQWPLIYKIGQQIADKANITVFNHLSLLHAKMPKYGLIMRRQTPKGRRWPCLRIIMIH